MGGYLWEFEEKKNQHLFKYNSFWPLCGHDMNAVHQVGCVRVYSRGVGRRVILRWEYCWLMHDVSVHGRTWWGGVGLALSQCFFVLRWALMVALLAYLCSHRLHQ